MAPGDDLNDPLGLERPPARRRQFSFRLIAFGIMGLALAGGAAYLNVHGDPRGGEPHVVAAIVPAVQAPVARPTATASVQALGSPDAVTGTIAPAAGDDTAAQIERQSGVQVIRGGGGTPPGALIINVPHVLAQRLNKAPDLRLVEKSRYGLLPRVGADGSRASSVYARPWSPSPSANGPRVALIIGGLGLSRTATAEAIHSLPGEVTLAFAPYGADLQAQVNQAREAGHEVILQLPMEPIDYPQTNPGPHTLLANASLAENTDSLHWLLGRFTGYTGVANFMGTKFINEPSAFKPILREIAARGLFYFDDGSTAESIGLSLAADIGLPAARADVVLDAGGMTDTVETNLARLVAIAREKGIAIGMASDLPDSVAQVAHFAQTAKARGLVLIPLSAAVTGVTQDIQARGIDMH